MSKLRNLPKPQHRAAATPVPGSSPAAAWRVLPPARRLTTWKSWQTAQCGASRAQASLYCRSAPRSAGQKWKRRFTLRAHGSRHSSSSCDDSSATPAGGKVKRPAVKVKRDGTRHSQGRTWRHPPQSRSDKTAPAAGQGQTGRHPQSNTTEQPAVKVTRPSRWSSNTTDRVYTRTRGKTW